MIIKKVKGLIKEEKVKYCPLWSIVFGKPDKAPCIDRKCGMFNLCNPFVAEQEEKAKEESQELKTFRGGHDEQKDKD